MGLAREILKKITFGLFGREGPSGQPGNTRQGCPECWHPGSGTTKGGDGLCKHCKGEGCAKDERPNNGKCGICLGTGWLKAR